MKHGPPSLARLVAWSALLLGLSVGGAACGDRPPVTNPPAREMPDAERSTVEVSPAQGTRANGQDTVDIRVTVRKADGSALAGQTVSVAASGEGNTLTQAAGATNDEGVAVAKLASSVAGIKTVTASVEAEGGAVVLASRPTAEFIAVAVPTQRLVFTAAPTSGTAGQALGAFEVAIQDEQGKTVTGASNTVTVALGAGSPQATLKGTLSVAAVNGVARFTTLVLEKAGTGYVLTASAAGLASATSAPFEVLSAAASKFVLTPPASAVTAGTAASLVLSVTDAFGNAATGYTGKVRVTVQGDTSAVLPADYTFTSADQGSHTFIVTLKAAGTRQVTVKDLANAALTASADVSVVPAAPAQLAFTKQPVSTGAGQAFEVQVALTDAFGNRTSVAAPPVTLTVNKGTLAGTTTVSPVDGVASFPGLSIAQAGTGYVLTASASGLSSVPSSAFDITASTVARFELTAASPAATAGAVVRFTLKAFDALGNPATAYRGTVHVSSSDTAATLPADHTFTAAELGVWAFDVTLKTAGVQSVTARDTANAQLTASASVTVSAAAASQLVFTQQPMNTGAGQSFEVRVELRDAYGNRPSASAPQVTLTVNKGTLAGTRTVSPVDGVASFPGLSIAQAGTGYVLTASASGLTSATSNAFDITTGSATKLVLTAASTSVTAGSALSVTVTAQDAAGNRVTGYTGTVSFTLSDTQATKPADVVFAAGDAGQKTVSVTFKTAGDQTVSASDGSLTGSLTVRVNGAAATKLVFRAQPTSAKVRQVLPAVRVALVDAYDNVADTSTTQIELGLAGGNNAATLSGTVKVTPVSGIATFSNLSVDQQGTDFWLVAMAGTLNSVESARFTITDDVAPATATLSVAAKTSTQVDLAWRAVGDDGTLGNATSHELRYATTPLNAGNFSTGIEVLLEAPLPSGSAETARVTGLSPGTRYYFGLKVTDDVGNSSLALLDLSLSTDVCEGFTCTPNAPTCAADGVSRVTYTATCVDVGGTPTCQQQDTATACTGSNAVCFNATCDTAARPTGDQLSFTEVMHTPTGATTEYIELTNHTDSLLNLNGLTVSYENSAELVRSFLVGTGSTPVVVGRKGRIVLARNKDLATNGGVAASFQYPTSISLDGSGVLNLSNGGTQVASLLYSSDFPQTAGKAMNLSSLLVGTRSAAQPWYWCDSTDALSGGNYGTPQAANSSCGIPAAPTMSYCFIQNPKTLPSTPAGTPTVVTGRFKAPGVTDRNTAGNDNYPHVVAELGYGPSTSNATTWTWTASPFNSDYSASVSQEDEVAGTLNIATPGDFKYGFRFAFRDPTTNTLSAYTYCGQSDIADPANGIFGTVTVTGSSVPTTDHVVISEYAPSGPGGDNDEFIELYNPTNAEVDISGWKLQYKSATGTAYNNAYTLPANSKIAARGFFLVTAGAYSGTVTGDASYGTTLTLSASIGFIRLGKVGVGTALGDALTVDRLGYGTPQSNTVGDSEGGSPFTTIPASRSAGTMERKAVASSTAATMEGGTDALRGNGYDSDNNANDFVLRTTRNPQNKASGPEVP